MPVSFICGIKDNMMIHKRSAFRLLDLLGEVGGLGGALTLIGSFIIPLVTPLSL